MAATAASVLLRLATTPGCVCEECEPECDDECVEWVSRRLLDDTRLLLLPELLAPLVGGALSEGADAAPDWSRNSWEAEDELVL